MQPVGNLMCLGLLLVSSVDCAAGSPRELADLKYQGRVTVIGCLAFSPDGKTLAVGTKGIEYKRGGAFEGEVVFWDSVTWKPRDSFTYDQYVDHIDFSPDGRWFAASCFSTYRQRDWERAGFKPKEGYVVVHDLHGLKPVAILTCDDIGLPKNHFSGVRFSSDGKGFLTVAGTEAGANVRVLDVPTFGGKREIPIPRPGKVAFAHDGRVIACAAQGCFDLPSGNRRKSVRLLENAQHMLFSPKDSMLVIAEGWGRGFWLVDVKTQEYMEIPGLTDNKVRADAVAITLDERILGVSESVGMRSWIHFFDLAKRKKLFTWEFDNPRFWVQQLAFSPDGKMITNGYKVWKVEVPR